VTDGRPTCFATSACRQPLPDFLLHDLPKLLEDVPLAVRAQMWYVHNDALESFTRAMRDVLDNNYHNR
jgi:hypothetical protein